MVVLILCMHCIRMQRLQKSMLLNIAYMTILLYPVSVVLCWSCCVHFIEFIAEMLN